MQTPSSPRRVTRVRHELHRRDVQVTAVERLGASFVRITFTGEALAGFVSASFDDHVKFMFEDGAGETVRRDYTPRRFDLAKRELTLEFALHGDGQACRWAEQAQVGQRAVIGGPRGSMIIPSDYDWHLLVGDATALPAMHRRLEELPAGSQAIVVAQLEHPDDRRAFDTEAQLDLTWVDDAQGLIEAVSALQLPAGDGFAWGAGEAASMREVRRLLVEGKGLSKDAMRLSAYWRRGASDFHEDLTD